MLVRSLDAIIAGAAPGLGRRWTKKIKEAVNLKAFGALPEEELVSIHDEVMAKLSRWFVNEADKNEIGAFFVMMGKEYCALGVPISELTWALLLDRKAVTEFLVENDDLEGAHRIYALMEAADRVSDFFMLGAYYITRGYLEETFLRMRKGEKLSDTAMQKYFKDDFFFK